MAAGDAQRVWYLEMIDELKKYWTQDMEWSDVITFCDRMILK